MWRRSCTAKAAIGGTDEKPCRAQARHDVVGAELELKQAFFADNGPALQSWRRRHQLPADPLAEHRRSGYEWVAATERRAPGRAGPGHCAGAGPGHA